MLQDSLDYIRENYISISQAAARLGVIPRRVRALAKSGRIADAVQIGAVWAIPKNFTDPRMKRGRPSLFSGSRAAA